MTVARRREDKTLTMRGDLRSGNVCGWLLGLKDFEVRIRLGRNGEDEIKQVKLVEYGKLVFDVHPATAAST